MPSARLVTVTSFLPLTREAEHIRCMTKSGKAEWYKQILIFPRSSAGHLCSDDDALEVSLAACCPSRLLFTSFPRWGLFWHCLAFPWDVLNLGATVLASRLVSRTTLRIFLSLSSRGGCCRSYRDQSARRIRGRLYLHGRRSSGLLFRWPWNA
ncbi:hypothetical protein JMJ77_0010839 [Colletotrichum scovillei]|uniref:Uncharacterized protein n=1 Tax=Colletotrichum scovillei TaxID=1209932 RepID=A0A9P7R2V6_9PEZI|nr:hypothetical protein JMJ77_0010839 [Colletotrichum scovillei]KAG7059804.1 hypothetical protein JMJ78_0015092 [Colletotrichum scovillei]KAG7067253.1 hypothetical protein JMJ76_0008695 [Colletotrichum scovillei]